MAGSPPNRRTQRPFVITASRGPPGRSSSAPKTRPSIVPASNTGKKSAVTWIAFTCSGVGAAAQVEARPREVVRADRLERLRVLFPGHELGDRHAVAEAVPELELQPHQAVRLAVGQRLQQNAVDHREDGGVGSDSESERGDRDGGEAGAAKKLPERQPNVLEQCVHVADSSSLASRRSSRYLESPTPIASCEYRVSPSRPYRNSPWTNTPCRRATGYEAPSAR